VSQTSIEYRNSPLSAGAAGSVRGGDRLPWVETGPNEDNFSPLESLGWQVHVYGEPRPGLTEACAQLRLPIHTFAWSPTMSRSGFVRGAIYLIRPDGYVALVDPDADPDALRHYFAALRLAGTAEAPSSQPAVGSMSSLSRAGNTAQTC
jgi:hypothetical protein